MSAQHTPEMLEMVAVYALGGVDAETGECAAVRAHLATCPLCQEEFRQASAAAVALGRSVAQPPPPALREKILGSLPERVVPLPARRRSGWLIPATVAAVVLVAVGVFWKMHQVPPQTWAVACTPAGQPCHVEGSLTLAGAGLQLQLRGLAALPAGKQYQAWMIVPHAAPKPEPVFSPDAGGNGNVSIDEPPVKGAIVAVTVEPTGGSRQPTTKPILVSTIE